MANSGLIKKNKEPINLEDSVILNCVGIIKIELPYSKVQHLEDMQSKEHINPPFKLKEITVYNNGFYMTEYANY